MFHQGANIKNNSTTNFFQSWITVKINIWMLSIILYRKKLKRVDLSSFIKLLIL